MKNTISESEITQCNKWEIGRYTIIELVDSSGFKGVGISRKSQLEKRNNKNLSFEIAKGRAFKALSLKKEHKLLYHPFMG